MAYTDKNALYNANLKAVLNEIVANINAAGGTRLMSNPTLAQGTGSAAKIKHAAFDIMKDGVMSTISTGEVEFTATTHDLADGKGAVYNVYLDGTTVKILMGTATDEGTGAVCPATPTGKVKMGEVKIVTAGAIFDATTTLLSAGTVTDTYVNKIDVAAGIA